MFAPLDARYLPATQAALRIAAGSAFFVRGAQKTFGWFGGYGPDGGTASLLSQWGAAGLLETVLGLLIVVGLYTRLAAFVASGEMAVAYFWVHVMSDGLFWWGNQGEPSMLFAFIFLMFAASGAGPFSLDASIAKRRATSGDS